MYSTPSLLETSLIGSSEVIQSNATFSLIGICQKVLTWSCWSLPTKIWKKNMHLASIYNKFLIVWVMPFGMGNFERSSVICMLSIKKKEIIQFFTWQFQLISTKNQIHCNILSIVFTSFWTFLQPIIALMMKFVHKGKINQQQLYCYLAQPKFSAVKLLSCS